MSEALGFNELLARRVRTGTWEDQKISTYRKIREAIEKKHWDDAAALADYFVDEARVCYDLYQQWIQDLNNFLKDNGVSEEEVNNANERILDLLKLPDGRSFRAPFLWSEFLAKVQKCVKHCHRQESGEALAALDDLKESWRRIHDRDVDHCYGLMNEIAVRFGEHRIRDMYDHVLLPLFTWRYDRFDIDKHPWDEGLQTLLYVAIEAMRGHLCGPGRQGEIEFLEEEDRYGIRFDPCGSGQRTLRGDVIEGTPARMKPPYNWGVTKEAYDWSWNKKGVCYYCAHCCVLMEQMPIDKFGYPIRVVDAPVYENAQEWKCTWYMYKDPTKVPEHLYERVGRKKPASFGSKSQKAPSTEAKVRE